jgi:NAD(P)H-dependent flavin oxidoreductase YrpB (nitropropane dioxygenase family)
MTRRLNDLLRCDLPIQLAPMGSVSATAALPLAVAAAGGHGMYPALALPPAALAPVIDVLAERTAAFGVNFIVPFMDRGSLELVVDRAPYVDFFLADPDPALVGSSTRPAQRAAGRSRPRARRGSRRRPAVTW